MLDPSPAGEDEDAVVISIRPPLFTTDPACVAELHGSLAARSVDSRGEHELGVDGRREAVRAADTPSAGVNAGGRHLDLGADSQPVAALEGRGLSRRERNDDLRLFARMSRDRDRRDPL